MSNEQHKDKNGIILVDIENDKGCKELYSGVLQLMLNPDTNSSFIYIPTALSKQFTKDDTELIDSCLSGLITVLGSKLKNLER